MPRFVLLLFLLAPVAQVSNLCFALSGAAPQEAVSQEARQLLRLEESLDAMGSTFSVVLYGYDRNQMEAATEAVFDEVRRLDRLLSNYRPESDLSEVNRFAAERPVKVTPEVFQLLSKCLEVSRESEGAFDISVGPLMKVWGFYRGTGHLPRKEEMARALAKTGYRKIQLDSENRTVRFTRAGVELDPGGIGKGYAVDRMIEILKENGIASALVTAGGSSIYGLGAPKDSRGWEVKIRDPKNQRKTVADVYLKDESMSTSGSYEKFFEADGKIYSHIMDPRTGYPASGVLAVSVVAPKTLESEAWTKPYFILGRQWTANHKPKNFRVFLCEDRAEQPCAWLQ
jgi:thiamine biosynthesis lipoprotein